MTTAPSVAISAAPAGRDGFPSPADPDRRRPSEGMDEDVEAVGMGDNRRRSRITLERLLGMLM